MVLMFCLNVGYSCGLWSWLCSSVADDTLYIILDEIREYNRTVKIYNEEGKVLEEDYKLEKARMASNGQITFGSLKFTFNPIELFTEKPKEVELIGEVTSGKAKGDFSMYHYYLKYKGTRSGAVIFSLKRKSVVGDSDAESRYCCA